MAGARTVTDEELLGGGDDDDPGAGLDALDEAGDGGEDDQHGATPVAAAVEDPGDSVEFQIVDGDEADQGDAGEEQEAEAQAGADGDDFDTGDAGDEVGDDLLTAEERKTLKLPFQKRLSRERQLKRESDAIAARESAARVAAQSQLLESRKATAAVLLENLDLKISNKTAELRAAKDAANTDDELKLQGELDDLRAQRRDIGAAKQQLEAIKTPEAGGVAPAVNPVLDRWKARNRWIANKDFAAEYALVEKIDKEIFAEGKLKVNEPGYFNELDRRLNAQIPSLRAKVQKVYGTQAPAKKVVQQRVAPVSRAAPTVRQANAGGSKTKVVLSRADIENMERFGLPTNPNTPEGRKALTAYAQEKRNG